MWKRILPSTAAIALFASAPALAAGPTITVTAKDAPLAAYYSAEGTLLGWTRAGRVSVTSATGDVTGDGVADRVTSADGIVTVYDRGVAVYRFSPYGDRAIIAIALSRAIIAIAVGPTVKVYDTATLAAKAAFFPFGGAGIAGVAIA